MILSEFARFYHSSSLFLPRDEGQLEQSRKIYVENYEDNKQVFYKPKHPRIRRR